MPARWRLREMPADVTDRERMEWEMWYSYCLTPRERLWGMFLAVTSTGLVAAVREFFGDTPGGALWYVIPAVVSLIGILLVASLNTEPARGPTFNPKPPWVKKPPPPPAPPF